VLPSPRQWRCYSRITRAIAAVSQAF